ncbi:MAG: Ig-like domain-containing protein [Pyrinomonadaceae bacterium]
MYSELLPKRLVSFVLIVSFALIGLVPSGFAQSSPEPALFSYRRVSPDVSQLLAAPSVRILGLRHFARVVGPVPVSVQVFDDVGISKIELYADQTLLATYNVIPGITNVLAPFIWNSAATTNGKHMLSARAYDAEGNVQTAAVVIICRNYNMSAPVGNSIALNPFARYQTITGWEATAEAAQFYSPAWNNYKNNLLDQAVNDLGLNRVRLEIKSGIENPTDYFAQWQAGQITESQYNAKRYEIINDNSDPNNVNPSGFKWSSVDRTVDSIVVPMRQRLAARGEQLWVNVNYVDFGSSTFEHKNSPNEYAEFVLATYQHLQNTYGFVPNSWEVILEPDTSAAGWSSSQVAQAIKAAGDRLLANGFTPNFVAPSTTDAGNAPNYIDQIAQTQGAMQYVGQFAYHRYAGGTTSIIQQIAARATTYGKTTGMQEWIGADHNTLHQDLKVGNNSSWQQFTLAGPISWGSDSGDRYYIVDDTNVSNPVLTMGSRTKFLRQYFKFIRAGAQRIGALTGNANFDPVAFINPNGKYVVVVKASTGGNFSIQGLPPGTYGIKYTTSGLYNIDLNDITILPSQVLSTNIPGVGVITVYAK